MDGERHGYEIMQGITRDSNGETRLGSAADGERSPYYRLTLGGINAAASETGWLKRLLALAKHKAAGTRAQRGKASQ